jgi:hypothetical protein
MIYSLEENYIDGEDNLTTIKVSNLNKDNTFGGRNITVSLGPSSFRTPIKTATQKDYHAASSLPHTITIKNPISEFVFDFNNSTLDAFTKGNGSLKKRRDALLEQSLDMMRSHQLMSTVQFPSERRISQNELMLFLLLQNTPILNIVSIPPFQYKDIREFKKIIVDFSEKVKERKQQAMPILPINQNKESFVNEFSALREMHQNGTCNVIGFQYANPIEFSYNFLEIFNHKDENVWYHCFGIPRTPRGKNQTPVAHVHELQNWGLDTFSPKVTQLGKKQVVYLIKKSESTQPNELSCQRFDSPTLGILKENLWKSRYNDDLHCNCPVCKGQDMKNFKEKYSHELNGDFNPNLLFQADKVHELVSGSEEFHNSMKAIESDDLHTYFKSKEFTKDRIEPPS